MKLYVRENRTESFSPIYKELKEVLTPDLEIDNLISQLFLSNKNKALHCNSFFAEKTINVIIDYFNEQVRLESDLKKSILDKINDTSFAHHMDNQQLTKSIELNAENSFTASANGMKNILGAFIKYSDFATNSNSDYFESIDFNIEPVKDVHDLSKIWVEQTIDEPWFK